MGSRRARAARTPPPRRGLGGRAVARPAAAMCARASPCRSQPRANSSLAAMLRSSGRFVVRPSTTTSSSAARRRASARARVSPCTHELGQQPVVARADHVARRRRRRRRGCPGRAASAAASTRAGGRQEAVIGVLGVDPRLDARGRAAATSPCSSRSGPPGGDLELAPHDVDARDELGDRVLDLDPRVHLEEVPGCRPARAGTPPCPRRRSRPPRRGAARRRRASARSARPTPGAGRLLDDLLVAALGRAVALAEVDAGRRGASRRICTSTWRAPSTKRS